MTRIYHLDSLDCLSHVMRKVQGCVGENHVNLYHKVVAESELLQ